MSAAEVNNTFDATLRQIRSGGAITELSTRLAEVVSAVRSSGRGGKLRLELTITPASRGETIAVTVEDEITVKLPRPEKASTIFYTNEQNLLQRTDPRQAEFDMLRKVETPAPVILHTVQETVAS